MSTKRIRAGVHEHIATGERIEQVSNTGVDSWRPYSWRTSLGDFAYLRDAVRALDADYAQRHAGCPADAACKYLTEGRTH